MKKQQDASFNFNFANNAAEYGAQHGFAVGPASAEQEKKHRAQVEEVVKKAREGEQFRIPPRALDITTAYWDGVFTGERIWIEAAVLCDDGADLKRAAWLYCLGLLIDWDLQKRYPHLFLFRKEAMRSLLKPGSGEVTSFQDGSDMNAFFAHTIMNNEPDKAFKRLNMMRSNGLYQVLIGRLAFDSCQGFAMGMPISGSQELTELYVTLFLSGTKLLQSDPNVGFSFPVLALLWERGYVQSLTMKQSPEGMAEARAALAEYEQKAPPHHFCWRIIQNTKRSLDFMASHVASAPLKHYQAEHFKSVSDTRKCLCCETLEGNLKSCSGCLVVRYCSQECQKKDWANHKSDCKRWGAAKERKGPGKDQKLYKVQTPIGGKNNPLMVYDKNHNSFFKANMLPTSHPQYDELAKEVTRRGSLGARGYFYGQKHKVHGMWFDTVLVSPKEDW